MQVFNITVDALISGVLQLFDKHLFAKQHARQRLAVREAHIQRNTPHFLRLLHLRQGLRRRVRAVRLGGGIGNLVGGRLEYIGSPNLFLRRL